MSLWPAIFVAAVCMILLVCMGIFAITHWGFA